MRKRTAKAGDAHFWGCSDFPNCRGYRPYREDGGKRGKHIENPSPMQVDAFDFIQYGSGNAVIEAVAGSGKTSTMVHASTLFSKQDDAIFLAFNKHIADELKTKLPFNVDCGTMHSICLRAIRECRLVDIDSSKLRNIVKSLVDGAVPDSERETRIEVSRRLMKAIPLIKATLINAEDTVALMNLFSEYNIDFPSDYILELVLELAQQVIERCAADQTAIDFDDMIWHVHVHDITIKKYDWVVVDEAQDLNNLQMEILLKMVKPGKGRVIAVGDRHQSIYGFRGANTQAIPLLIEKLNAEVLPLSICYRCPTRHVELAKALVPQIEAAETAIPGVIEHYTESEVNNQLRNGDLVLCRNNAPLVSLCFRLIERGIKATIKGKDIGKSLIDLIESLKGKNLDDMLKRLSDYQRHETAKLQDKGAEMAAQNVADRCAVIFTVADKEGVCSIEDVTAYLNRLFQDDEMTGVICSSIHKAKGLEADSVYILHPDLMPNRFAKTAEECQQEANIEYVALTRSKNFLGFINKD